MGIEAGVETIVLHQIACHVTRRDRLVQRGINGFQLSDIFSAHLVCCKAGKLTFDCFPCINQLIQIAVPQQRNRNAAISLEHQCPIRDQSADCLADRCHARAQRLHQPLDRNGLTRRQFAK